MNKNYQLCHVCKNVITKSQSLALATINLFGLITLTQRKQNLPNNMIDLTLINLEMGIN